MHKKGKHFSFSVGIDLVAILVVFVVAFLSGYFAKESHINFHGFLAQTVTGSNSTTRKVSEVTFSVTPSSVVKCELDTPRTQVLFSISDTSAGEFTLSSSVASAGVTVSPGEYFFPNGTYHWSALVKTGYVGSGPLFGDFVLNSTCPAKATVNTDTSTSSTETTNTPTTKTTSSQSTESQPAVAPETTPATMVSPTSSVAAPSLKVFIDNTPVTDKERSFDNEEVELRVATPPVKRITLIAASSSIFELGGAVKDDLLSTENSDVWSFVWDVEGVPPGTYKVFARVISSDNHITETASVTISILHKLLVKQSLPAEISDKDVDSVKHKEAILSRVTAPSLCVNKEECQVYCASHPEEKERCTLFARTALLRLPQLSPSLTDGIDPLRIQIILNNQKRSKEIPEEVSTPEKLKDFCGELSHADICIKILLQNDLANEATLNAKKELLTQIKNQERQLFTERIGAREFVDSDMDGIADYDEVNIYHTDPNDQDTDHDGFPDGAEILAHTNPLGGKRVEIGTSTTMVIHDEFVKLENPHLSGTTFPKLFTVDDVSFVQNIAQKQDGSASSSELLFRGYAIPNSFVTLYIFSDPIVVTIKTDETGAWTYVLDKALPDGSHEVYSAITDARGHILAKSEPLPFVKTASAVSVGAAVLLPGNTEPGFFSGASLYAFIAIIIGILGIALSIIGFVVRRRDVENIGTDKAV